MDDDDICVYCDIQMPLEQGVALLDLVNDLRSGGQHPCLDEVFRHMQIELEGSIELEANGSSQWGVVKIKH